jgi:CDP-diacylglycerol--glycerol-3-phosphate 3-phosphatidyltransferase|tara:strand:+ start:880 stop:1425 length:546 start_codon:yes stop_codon:yes gene_type:complete
VNTANLLTGVRLILVLPVAVAFARPDVLSAGLLAVLVGVAIATDYVDGKVARWRGTASPGGQLFDHGTDFLFVTTGLTGAALAGLTPLLLPVLIAVAFSQYVFDSYMIYRQKRLRMSGIGRWNGVLYFVPLVLLAVARLGVGSDMTSVLNLTARGLSYALVVSTIVSIIDRGTAAHHRPER